MTSELKPCPFCGGKAEIERYGCARFSTEYCCQDCGCSLETSETFNHGRGWNTRAVPDVSELQRYNIVTNIHGWDHEECEYGDYVLYSEAAAIIAAKVKIGEQVADKIFADYITQLLLKEDAIKRAEAAEATISDKDAEIARLSKIVNSSDMMNELAAMLYDAEAKLTQTNDQKPLGSVLDGRFYLRFMDGGTIVYSAPVASDADLRVENERLRQALKVISELTRATLMVDTAGSAVNRCNLAIDIATAALNPSEQRK